MNERLSDLIKKNKKWADKVENKKPGFFKRIAEQKGARYLWFGCSDARVPATQLLGLGPGDLFVHRNIANQVNHEDISSMVVLKIGIEIQNVSDIIVCGHTQCLGVHTAMQRADDPLLNKWLQPLIDLHERKKPQLESLSIDRQLDALVRLNVEQQVRQIARNSVVQKAWDEGRDLAIHGLIYDIDDGKLEDLNVSVTNTKAD